MKKQLLILGLALGVIIGNANAQDCTGDRYLLPTFTVEKTADVQYGSNFGQDGTTMVDLKFDIYLPENDTDTDRPLILLAHGGSFIGGDKADLEAQCTAFASLGYVAVSMQYRLLTNLLDPALLANLSLGFKKEVVRAVHDMRAAIRFFRKSVAEDGNPYGIDPDMIIVGGFSAGAILANHVTYLDDESKVPSELTTYFNDQGGLEGETGNPGFNSVPQMALSWCGAILDTTWMETGAQPYFGMHNLGDQTVPNIEGEPDIGLPIPVTLQGDSLMYVRALNESIPSFYKSYPGNVHCQFPVESGQYVIDFLYEQLCDGNLSIAENEATVLFSIYPNPTEESFFVEIPENSAEWNISVVNMVGQTIHSENMNAHQNKISVNSSSFDAGIYIVKLTSKDGREAVKKVIVR